MLTKGSPKRERETINPVIQKHVQNFRNIYVRKKAKVKTCMQVEGFKNIDFKLKLMNDDGLSLLE